MAQILNYCSAIVPGSLFVCHVISIDLRMEGKNKHRLKITEETRRILGGDTFKVFVDRLT